MEQLLNRKDSNGYKDHTFELSSPISETNLPKKPFVISSTSRY